MKTILYISMLMLVGAPAIAQSITDAELQAAWRRCEPYKVVGHLAGTIPWGGGPEYANCPLIEKAYKDSAAEIAAKKAADKAAIDAAAAKLAK